MKRNLFPTVLILLVISSTLFTSCGNIDIVKRRYRPGFHVDVSKKQKDAAPKAGTEAAETTGPEDMRAKAAQLPKQTSAVEAPTPIADATASADIITEPAGAQGQGPAPITLAEVNEAMLHPFRELKRENLDGELRRAVFNTVDEKSGWSVLGFVSTGLGAVALAMVIVGMVLLVSLIFGTGVFYWWILALIGMLMGIAAMVTGILGMRETGRGEKRGRGFAIGGMIGGIISLALGLITLFWGLIYTFIQRVNAD